ncbi:hypothetical protein V9L20_12535 [Variovorax sp. CCNWLW225]|uniref:hypothetical protein n=1 Tax=Variovorax sp. CCNWLW225 TaxID=3127462 RepID=UPI0030773BDA
MAFDKEKLLQNALDSIRLGVEDFQRALGNTAETKDPARTLSAVRNLFAGTLLLFKYRIVSSTDDDDEAEKLIFIPPEILPFPDDDGGIEWRPAGKFKSKTIDVADIKKRFESFEIKADWEAIDRLQNERNHLEHLHPSTTIGAISDFVAALFPMLRDFITSELKKSPPDLLGESWTAMLQHHKFYAQTLEECADRWKAAGVPKGMWSTLEAAVCDDCGSQLLRPSEESIEEEAKVEHHDHTYVCVGCGHSDDTTELLMKTLEQALVGRRSYKEGITEIEDCPSCDHASFVVAERECRWCGHTLDYENCNVCNEPLGLDDQDNDGLCSYHHYLFNKDD